MEEVELSYLYELASILSSLDNKIVVKGAVILASQAKKLQRSSLFRMTKDIDLNYAGEGGVTSVSTLVQKAVNLSSKSGRVEIRKHNRTTNSCSLEVKSLDGVKLAELDVQLKTTLEVTSYETAEGYVFNGQSINLIITDKLLVASSDNNILLRRIKDLFDIYFLASIYDFDNQEILERLDLTDRFLGSFAILETSEDKSKQSLWYAYEKYRGIVDKPDFDTVVSKVKIFCEPFINNSYKHLKWSSKDGCWYESQ